MAYRLTCARVQAWVVPAAALLLVPLVGCSAARRVPFEPAEVIQVSDTLEAWGEFMRYVDPQKPHAPLQVSERQRYFYAGDREVRYLPEDKQLVIQWSYYFPGVLGQGVLTFEFVTALEEADPTSFEIWNGEEDGLGWFVTADCREFWSGVFDPDPFLAAINPGRATLDEDGFSFPSAVGLAFAGKDAPEFKIAKLRSKRECLRVIGILTAVFESCGFGSEEAPTSASVLASVPRPGKKTAPTSARGGYRH